jgi:hypothetical protein
MTSLASVDVALLQLILTAPVKIMIVSRLAVPGTNCFEALL